MDWKTFIAQMTNSLAWPLAAVFLIYHFKDRFAELLFRLKRFKHKDTELEFAEKLDKLAVESQTNKNDLIAKFQKPELEEQHNFLLKLSEISPRSAVIESFIVLETALAKALARAYPETGFKKVQNPIRAVHMLQEKGLRKDQLYQFDELRKLRNEIAHMEEFELKNMNIEAYINVALSISNYLEHFNPQQKKD